MVGIPGLTGGSLGSLIVRIDADMRGLQTGLRAAEGRVQTSSKKMQAFSRNIDAAIKTVNILGTVAVVTGGLLVKSASNFESAFAGVRKTVDATETEFFELSEGIINMSKRIPVATTELARIQELAGQLGVRGVDNLTEFTETVAKIAVTTNLTSESAATDFARIANIMQLPLEQVDQLGASVVELGNNFATTEAEIVSFATRIAGAGRVVGLSTADILGIGTAFSSVGVKAERGGTAVNKALIKIASAVESGGDELQLFAEISGQTVEEFTQGFQDDAAKAFAVFIEGLGTAGLKGAQILEDLELGDQRLVQAFLSVGGAGGILTDAVNTSNRAFEENIALTEEANKRFSTTGSKTELLKNNMNALAITLGERLLPAFNNILISANAVVGVFDKLFGAREGPESLEKDLFRRIELIDLEIEKQREILVTALGNASARAEAEENLNTLYELRSRAVLTLKDIEQKRFEDNEAQNAAEIKSEQKVADSKVKTEVKKNVKLLADFKEFQKGLKKLKDTELKEFVERKEAEELTTKNFEKKKTELIEKELKIRDKAKQDSANLDKQIQSEGFDLAVDIIRSIAGESKIAALAIKGIRIAEIIISTATGVARAFAEFPFPIASAIATKIKILGALQVATVVATSFQEGSDDVPVRGLTDPGEIVIPKTFASAIRAGRLTLAGPEGGQGGQVITNNFQFDNVQLGDDIELDDFTAKLGEDVVNKSRSVS